jgi:ketosteroid isomerase-like protein
MIALLLVSLLLSAPQTSNDRRLAARLQQLEDKQEIEQLLLDYGRHLDSRDFVAYGRLFAKDGEWVGGFGTASGGPAGIQVFMEKAMGTGPNAAHNYHLLTNFVITVTGDTATAWSRWSFVVPGPKGRPTAVWRPERGRPTDGVGGPLRPANQHRRS